VDSGISSKFGRNRFWLSLVEITVTDSSQIVVEALTRNVKEDHVREIFGKYGIIKDLRMPMNPTCTSFHLVHCTTQADRTQST
jgi:RNA recognition motif-containing protein